MAAFEPFIPRGDNASPSLQQRRRFWRLLQSSPFVQILGSKKTTFLLAVGTLFIIIIGLFKFRPQASLFVCFSSSLFFFSNQPTAPALNLTIIIKNILNYAEKRGNPLFCSLPITKPIFHPRCSTQSQIPA